MLTVGVTNSYDKEKKQTYTQYVCFDYECEKKEQANVDADGFMEMPEDATLPCED